MAKWLHLGPQASFCPHHCSAEGHRKRQAWEAALEQGGRSCWLKSGDRFNKARLSLHVA